jgi:glycosyltransferase involved in cell wall biosynthesis
VSVTVVIPTHPGRSWELLGRAIKSVHEQTLQPRQIVVANDLHGYGAGATRNDGLNQAHSTYTAFLDSDDEFLPDHLNELAHVMDSDKDIIMAFSWFEAVGMPDPLGHFGLPFDPAHPHHTTVTTMVDTDIARWVGGFPTSGEGGTAGCLNDDWIFLLRMCEYAVKNNKKIVHLPKRTWRYHGHAGNTSGKPTQGDAIRG